MPPTRISTRYPHSNRIPLYSNGSGRSRSKDTPLKINSRHKHSLYADSSNPGPSLSVNFYRRSDYFVRQVIDGRIHWLDPGWFSLCNLCALCVSVVSLKSAGLQSQEAHTEASLSRMPEILYPSSKHQLQLRKQRIQRFARADDIGFAEIADARRTIARAVGENVPKATTSL